MSNSSIPGLGVSQSFTKGLQCLPYSALELNCKLRILIKFMNNLILRTLLEGRVAFYRSLTFRCPPVASRHVPISSRLLPGELPLRKRQVFRMRALFATKVSHYLSHRCSWKLRCPILKVLSVYSIQVKTLQNKKATKISK